MSIAIFPGSFNPWHEGHSDIVKKALRGFDYVIVVQLQNPDKIQPEEISIEVKVKLGKRVQFEKTDKTLVEWIRKNQNNYEDGFIIVKGLRNAQDLEYETVQQYWNEDLGLKLPTFYVITDRKFRHMSSSAVRTVRKLKIK